MMAYPRNPHAKRILSLRGKMSFAMIAARLGISRNAVAGVCWRADWPSEKCIRKGPAGTMNGRGHHGPGKEAKRTLRRVN